MPACRKPATFFLLYKEEFYDFIVGSDFGKGEKWLTAMKNQSELCSRNTSRHF